jgi:DNA-binding NtrC family response regulator
MTQQRTPDQDIRVLVVDDERSIRFLMEKELPRAGCLVTCAESGEDALARMRAQEFDVVLMDLKMPGIGGMEALRRIRESGTSAEVVVLTGHPDVTTAIEAMKLGAYDYLTKPFKLAEVEIVLHRAAERRRLTQENTALRRMVAQGGQASLVLGQNRAMAAILATVGRIAAANATSHRGESGTGKGSSPRLSTSRAAAQPWPSTQRLPGSTSGEQLFGHEKGVHRRSHAEAGPGSRPRTLFWTRWRNEPGHAGEAPPSAGFPRVSAGGRHPPPSRGHANRGGYQQDHATGGGGGPVPRGSLLPAERRRHPRPSAAGASGRHSDPGGAFLGPVSGERGTAKNAFTGRPAIAGRVRVARQRPRTLEHHRTAGHPGARHSHRARRLAAQHPNPRPGAPEAAPGPVSLAEMECLHIARVLQETGGKKMQAARLLGIDIKTLNKKIRDYQITLPSTHS